MKKRTVKRLLLAVISLAAWNASATMVPSSDSFGTLAPATFGGSGIPNNSVAISTRAIGSQTLTLGLTATQRYANPALANDGHGSFSALRGVDQTNASSISGGLARWNIGYYVSGTGYMSAHTYNYRLLFDVDPSSAESFKTMAISTGFGNTAQNSFNLGTNSNEILYGYNFNAMAPGAYAFRLEAYNGSGVAESASIVVNVVPEPASVALLGIGLLGVAGMRRKNSRA